MTACFCFIQEKLEKELRDAQVRELMHAEEAAILDKVAFPIYELHTWTLL